ncbi:MAG: Bro-N domain-containing protein [Erythrobacter sp.]|uniref:BRO-N domain-containing protein n=1 Tax=Erythrobacter sp. TaxID=1042 RepID=UPI003A8361D3
MDNAINPHPWRENLRTIELDGEPWFHAKDICNILGSYVNSAGRSNPTMACACLDPDQKITLSRRTHNRIEGLAEFIGRTGSAIAVSESGLYKLTMRSDKQQAKAFQDWVTKDVLPAIRKTGGYLLNEKTTAYRTEHPQLFCGSRAPSFALVTESGLYKLTPRSDKDTARQATKKLDPSEKGRHPVTTPSF